MPGSDEDHDWFHTRNSQMDGKSKTSHISPTTLGQMIPVEEADINDLIVNNQASIPTINDLASLSVDDLTVTNLASIEAMDGSVTGNTQLNSLTGTRLSIDGSGTLNAAAGSQEGASVVMGSNQSLPTSTQTVVEFDTVSDGDTGAFDAANFEFVAPVDGRFRLEAQIQLTGLDTQVSLYTYSDINGRESRNRQANFASSGWPQTWSVVNLSAGDRMWVQAYSDDADGATITSTTSETYANFWRV